MSRKKKKAPQRYLHVCETELWTNDLASPIPSNDPGFPTLTIPGGLMWRLSQLPQATIGLIEGRARGIGNEFLLALDMRYSTTAPSVLFGQFEISVGKKEP